jgi:iron complex outermembrane recepter protein
MLLEIATLLSSVAATPSAPAAASEIVIVTATPLGDKSDALSQGVSVVTRDGALNASLSGGIGEALAGVPGVRATFYGPNASRPIIRGLGEDRIRLLLNGLTGIDASSVSPDHAPAIDGLDADRIEVLKGPAALRFGSNAVGGVVNVVDGRLPDVLPARPLEGEVFVGTSSAENAKAGAFRMSATGGKYVFRIDGLARSSDDYDTPSFLQTPALRAQTGDDTAGRAFNTRGEIWALGASAARIGARTNLAASVRTTNSSCGIPGEEAFIDLEQTRVDVRGVLKDIGIIESLTVSATGGDYSHSEIEFDGAVGTVFENSGYEARGEARLKPMGRFDMLWGIQFGSNDFSALGDEAFVLPVTIEQAGGFGFGRYSGENWGAEIGARYEQRTYSGLAGNRDFDLGSVSGGIFAKPIDSLRLSLSASRTERAPTEIELFADGPHAATAAFERGNSDLKTEISTSIEGGARFLAGGWQLQIDAWQASFDGFVAFAPTGEIEDELPLFVVTQKDATLKGVEVSVNGNLWSSSTWSVSGDVALDYVQARYDDGSNVARIPPRLIIIGLEAKRARFGLRAEVQVLGDQDEIAAFETPTSGATTFNLRANWQPIAGEDGLELVLEGRNLSDEDVREHTSFLKDQLPKPGRSLRLSARARF